ncbi:MAG TPA: pilus assembly protein PilM [Planctomycetota bacterium]|nr:pilus assembly protein PilM [Planctomycetota bacterium]
MTLACGLEVGANTIKAAVLDGTSRGAKLVDFVVRKLDGGKKGEEADVVSVVKEIVKKHRIPVANVVASVRAQEAVMREIMVPFTREDQIAKTIKFQAENYFHSTSIDDLVIEWLKFAEIEGKSKLLVAGVKKAHIERKLRFLEECGIDPVALDLDIAALYNAYHDARVFEGKGLVLCVEIEADTLKIVLVEDGKLRVGRAIRVRTGSIRVSPKKSKSDEGRISDEQSMSTEDSARLPVVILDDDEGFSLEDSQVTEEEREDFLGKIFLEIDRTVASVAQRRPVELIVLTGASCSFEGIEKIFEEHFEIPAQRVDLATRFGVKDTKSKGETSVSLQGVTAVGLALKGLGIDAAGLDFRQEEFRFRGKYEGLKKGVACALCLVFTLVFVHAFGLKQTKKERHNTLEGVKHMQEMVYTVLFPELGTQDPAIQHKKPTDPDHWFASLQAEQQRLSNLYGTSASIQGGNTSALVVFREFALAKARLGPQWGIEVTQARITGMEGQQSQFTLMAPGESSGIQLQREFEKSTVCEGNAQNSTIDPQTQKTRIDFVVTLKKKTPGG